MTPQGKIRARRIFRKYNTVIKAGGACAMCGYDKNLASLVFHHTDEKSMSMSGQSMASVSLKQVQDEIQKCILLCHNCHNEIHNPTLTMKNIAKAASAVNSKLMNLSEACKYFVSPRDNEG